MLAYSGAKVQNRFYLGDLVTRIRTGDWETRSVSERLPDYPGELACMHNQGFCAEGMTPKF